MDVDVPKNTFNIKSLKKIEETRSEVSCSKEYMKETNFYFNVSSKGYSKDYLDSPHKIFSWEQNLYFHPEDENKQANKISSGTKGKSCSLKKD